jgi:hypothetical protein
LDAVEASATAPDSLAFPEAENATTEGDASDRPGNSTGLDGNQANRVHEEDASLELIALSEELIKMVSEAARALTEAAPTADGGTPPADAPTSSGTFDPFSFSGAARASSGLTLSKMLTMTILDGVSRKRRMVSGSEEDNLRKYKTKRFFPGKTKIYSIVKGSSSTLEICPRTSRGNRPGRA